MDSKPLCLRKLERTRSSVHPTNIRLQTLQILRRSGSLRRPLRQGGQSLSSEVASAVLQLQAQALLHTEHCYHTHAAFIRSLCMHRVGI